MFKIHVGKNKENCPDNYVDNKKMKESTKEKYLGDYLTSKSNSKDTIQDRKTTEAMLSWHK